MNLPNALTILRIFLTIGFIFFVTQEGLLPVVTAGIFFALAAFTDFFDGYYAKRHNLISDFGKIMDPIADKFMILAAFFIFMRMHFVAEWMFYAIFAREVIVTGFRIVAMKKGKVLAAEQAGKYKTAFQIFAIGFILIFIIYQEAVVAFHWSDPLKGTWLHGIYVVMLFTVTLTFVSGVSYLWNNRKSLVGC